MLIEISKIHIGGYAIIKTGRRKNGLTFSVCILKLQINQIRVVFSRLKLWVKVVRHNSKCVEI